MATTQRAVRSRPIRLFLISMFAVPLVFLGALWAFGASVTVPAAISDHNYNEVSTALDGPGVTTLTQVLPLEQEQTYLWLLSNRVASNAALLATRKTIDQALPSALIELQSRNDLLSPTARAALDSVLADLRQLSSVRQSIDAGKLTPTAAFRAYSTITDAQFQSYYAETVDRGASLAVGSIGAVQASYSLVMAFREVTLVDGALAISKGMMSTDARQLFIASMATRRQTLTTGISLLSGAYRAGYTGAIGTPMYKQYEAMEDQIAESPGSEAIPVSATTWESVSGQYLKVFQGIDTANGVLLEAQSSASSSRLLTEAILAGGVGLLAVLVSLFLLVWFGRKVTGDLSRLHASVREMADERLPRVVDRLRRGEDVDVQAESPPPDASGIREISQIARSFGTVQEAAVAAAVEQAQLRKGVNQVFLNISMRNQSLLHRQLGMLDSMERRTSEPGELADLFRLDHLTTRMRRHAEGLIILSGSTPGRGWREPVPVLDVLRAAIAEVEDYVRVDVLSESRDLVAGNAVNDVIHLVAELVENATVFSPPNTRIEIRADRVGTGLVAEIEDRGLGLSEQELAGINQRLASPPEFDLANSEQLGLFVVSRLAARHHIRVALRPSVYGGTTAIVVLPFGVIVREEEARNDGWPTGGRPVLAPPMAIPGLPAGDPEPYRDGPANASPYGLHRLLSTVTGRRSGPGSSSDGGLDWPSAPSATGPQELIGQVLENTTPWPDAFHRGGASQEPPRPAAQDGKDTGPMPAGSHLGMPIRVPQASLAPQLRARRDTEAQPSARDAPAAGERSPEATRTLMNLMQQGWQLGRVDDLEDPAGNPTTLSDSEAGNGTD